jgi:DNA-binding MarR family transcriptional regulator
VVERPIPRLLLDASRALGSQIQEALEDRGLFELSPRQATTLLLVDRGGTRLTELAERAAVTKQAMMQAVDSLQSMGCLRRVPDPHDARAKMVKLTAKGLRHRAEARRAIGAVEVRVRRLLGERRVESLRSALVELAEPEG